MSNAYTGGRAKAKDIREYVQGTVTCVKAIRVCSGQPAGKLMPLPMP